MEILNFDVSSGSVVSINVCDFYVTVPATGFEEDGNGKFQVRFNTLRK
jgi:hypothetical protein